MSIIKIPINEIEYDSNNTPNICIEFGCIFDICFGVLRTIKENYNDPSVFDQSWITSDVYTTKCLLKDRYYYNPIYNAMKNKDMQIANDLLQNMYNNEIVYANILNNSLKSTMFKLVSTLKDIKGCNTMICNYIVLCKNSQQEQFIRKKIPGINTAIDFPEFTYPIKNYDLIIVEIYENAIKYAMDKKIEAKTIWIPDYRYNMDQDNDSKPSLEISAILADVNEIRVYEPYMHFTKPLG